MTSTPAPTSHPMTQQQMLLLLAGFMTAAFHIVFQAAVFDTAFRPDESKALLTFIDVFSGGPATAEAEYWSRVGLTLLCLCIAFTLNRLGFITTWTLAIAAIWPMTWFLFGKLYWEWFVFPLGLIRYDLTKAKELALIATLVCLLVVTDEQNLVVIIIFRSLLYFQKVGFRKAAPLSFLIFGLALDVMIETGIAASIPVIGPAVRRFDFTRNIVNPEYSLFETLAVFTASFHFFTIHAYYWWIDMIFSLCCLGLIVLQKGGWARVKAARYEMMALVCLLFGMASITHAFQNARYYFFYLPLVGALIDRRSYPVLLLLGIFHVLFKSLEGYVF